MIMRRPATRCAQEPARQGARIRVVTMPEELDHANAGQVNQRLAAAFADGASTVIADFTPTVFCDSSGIRELVLARKRALAGGAVFQAVIPDDRLLTYLTRTGVAGYLPVCPSLGQALAAGPGRQAADAAGEHGWSRAPAGGKRVPGNPGGCRGHAPAPGPGGGPGPGC
jgi:anti-sigma B factor antagonist